MSLVRGWVSIIALKNVKIASKISLGHITTDKHTQRGPQNVYTLEYKLSAAIFEVETKYNV
jgi:hypothetical protein